MHQTQFSEKIPYGGFSQIRSQMLKYMWISSSLRLAMDCKLTLLSFINGVSRKRRLLSLFLFTWDSSSSRSESVDAKVIHLITLLSSATDHNSPIQLYVMHIPRLNYTSQNISDFLVTHTHPDFVKTLVSTGS